MAKPPERETASHSVPERETPVRRGSSHPLRWERRSLEQALELVEGARVVGLAEPEERLALDVGVLAVARRSGGITPPSTCDSAKTPCSRTSRSLSGRPRRRSRRARSGASTWESQKSAFERVSGSRSPSARAPRRASPPRGSPPGSGRRAPVRAAPRPAPRPGSGRRAGARVGPRLPAQKSAFFRSSSPGPRSVASRPRSAGFVAGVVADRGQRALAELVGRFRARVPRRRARETSQSGSRALELDHASGRRRRSGSSAGEEEPLRLAPRDLEQKDQHGRAGTAALARCAPALALVRQAALPPRKFRRKQQTSRTSGTAGTDQASHSGCAPRVDGTIGAGDRGERPDACRLRRRGIRAARGARSGGRRRERGARRRPASSRRRAHGFSSRRRIEQLGGLVVAHDRDLLQDLLLQLVVVLLLEERDQRLRRRRRSSATR